MSVIEEAIREFSRLPGVGSRTATRLVHSLLRGTTADARRLARSIDELVERIRPCERCGTFAEEELCRICRDPARRGETVCVVESAFQVHSIDRTGEFRGRFHVLGGHLSPLDGIGPEELRIRELLDRVSRGDEGIREVILATNPSVEGEATAVYLEGVLRPLGVKVTRLARGLPVGSDLEFVDGLTLAEALSGRREM
ncbi:MAG: recombination protein RecR [Gemmatimonadales bacterium]|nr:MAG: recombination protein RecR [Gemmatimonadales bacterium]